jgi:hypothetical protein
MPVLDIPLSELQRHAAVACRLAADGVPGRATVTAVRETGRGVELTLEVMAGDRAPYTVVHEELLLPVAAAGFRHGARVPVIVDPDDERTLILG